MTSVPCNPNVTAVGSATEPPDLGLRSVPLHRLKTARRQERLSQRAMARRLGISVADVKYQELETTDLSLSVLHKWQKALKVPLCELVVEPPNSLSLPLLSRARMVRLMKTAAVE